MPPPFKLSRRKLKAAGACNLDHFFDEASNAKGGVIVYPNGWQAEDSTRVATERPIGFLWLAQRGLIPVSYRRAKDLIREIHGDKSFIDLVREYHHRARGDSPTDPPPDPPPP
jgi:hypothetical protein